MQYDMVELDGAKWYEQALDAWKSGRGNLLVLTRYGLRGMDYEASFLSDYARRIMSRRGILPCAL